MFVQREKESGERRGRGGGGGGGDLLQVLADVDDFEKVWVALETVLAAESQFCLQSGTDCLDGQM